MVWRDFFRLSIGKVVIVMMFLLVYILGMRSISTQSVLPYIGFMINPSMYFVIIRCPPGVPCGLVSYNTSGVIVSFIAGIIVWYVLACIIMGLYKRFFQKI